MRYGDGCRGIVEVRHLSIRCRRKEEEGVGMRGNGVELEGVLTEDEER